jgi:hypothetical protein
LNNPVLVGTKVWVRVLAYARQKKTTENKSRREKRQEKTRQEQTSKREE